MEHLKWYGPLVLEVRFKFPLLFACLLKHTLFMLSHVSCCSNVCDCVLLSWKYHTCVQEGGIYSHSHRSDSANSGKGTVHSSCSTLCALLCIRGIMYAHYQNLVCRSPW